MINLKLSWKDPQNVTRKNYINMNDNTFTPEELSNSDIFYSIRNKENDSKI